MQRFTQYDCKPQLNSFKFKNYELRNPNQDLTPFVSLIQEKIKDNFITSIMKTKDKEKNSDENMIILENQEQSFEKSQDVISVKIPFKAEIQFSKTESTQKEVEKKIHSEGDHCAKENIKNRANFIEKNHLLRKQNSIGSSVSCQKLQRILLENEEDRNEFLELEFFQSDQESKEHAHLESKSPYHQEFSKQSSKGKRKFSYWSISEKINFIAFIAVNKDLFIPKQFAKMNEDHSLLEKLAKYIDTDKTEKQCRQRLKNLKMMYQNDTAQMIEKECQKLGLTQFLTSHFQADVQNVMCFETNLGNSVLKLEVYPRKCILESLDIEEQIKNIIQQRLLIKLKLILRPQEFNQNFLKNEPMEKKIKEEKKMNNSSEEVSYNSNQENDFISVKIKICIDPKFYDEMAMSQGLSLKETLICKNIRLFQPVQIKIKKLKNDIRMILNR